jgi:hypothetical protein
MEVVEAGPYKYLEDHLDYSVCAKLFNLPLLCVAGARPVFDRN